MPELVLQWSVSRREKTAFQGSVKWDTEVEVDQSSLFITGF